jgi:hypothetical protein
MWHRLQNLLLFEFIDYEVIHLVRLAFFYCCIDFVSAQKLCTSETCIDNKLLHTEKLDSPNLTWTLQTTKNMAAVLARTLRTAHAANKSGVKPVMFVRNSRKVGSAANKGKMKNFMPGDIFPEYPQVDTEELYEDENGNWIPRGAL